MIDALGAAHYAGSPICHHARSLGAAGVTAFFWPHFLPFPWVSAFSVCKPEKEHRPQNMLADGRECSLPARGEIFYSVAGVAMSFADENQTLESDELEAEKRLDEPPRYRVLMHNDDYTTMEFVIKILQKIFHKEPPEAERITRQVHESGVGQCGVYTCEVAETKVSQVQSAARDAGYPLKCSMEKI